MKKFFGLIFLFIIIFSSCFSLPPGFMQDDPSGSNSSNNHNTTENQQNSSQAGTRLELKTVGRGELLLVSKASMQGTIYVVWSRNEMPVFPARRGDRSKDITNIRGNKFQIEPFAGTGEYFARVYIVYPNGSAAYSNQVMVELH